MASAGSASSSLPSLWEEHNGRSSSFLEEEALGGLTKPPTTLGQHNDDDEQIRRPSSGLDHSRMGALVEPHNDDDDDDEGPPLPSSSFQRRRAAPPLVPERTSLEKLQEASATPPPPGREYKTTNRRLVLIAIVILILIVLVLAATTVVLFVTDDSGGGDDDGDGGSRVRDVDLPTTTMEPTSLLRLEPTAAPSTPLPTNDKMAQLANTFVPTSIVATLSSAPLPSCPICATGEPLPYPTALLPNSTTLTCGFLERVLDDLLADSDDPDTTCFEWQVIASYSCGCTFPHPRAHCTLCGGSLPPPDILHQVTPVLAQSNQGVNLTCADLIYSAAVFAPNQEPDCSDQVIPQWAPYCDCRPTPRCSLCVHQQPVHQAFRDELAVVTTAGDNVTCAEFERSLGTFIEDCSVLQLYGILHCGCSSPHPESTCWLCPNGQVPPPEWHDKELEEAATFNNGRGRPLTCRDVYFDAALLSGEDAAAKCQDLQTNYAAACGCAPAMEESMEPSLTPVPSADTSSQPSAPCTLCADGLSPKDEFVHEFAMTLAIDEQHRNWTCGEVEQELDSILSRQSSNNKEDTTLDCLDVQLWSTLHCGCQPPPAACFLCPDGTVPPFDFKVVMEDDQGNAVTCAELYVRAAREIDHREECAVFQSTFAAACGCVDDEESLEPSSSFSSEPSAAQSSMVPSSLLSLAPQCHLCVNELFVTEEFRDEWALTSTTGQNYTCGQLEESLDDFTNDCPLLQLFGILHCGCQPRPHPQATCWLCPNGNVPPPEWLSLPVDSERRLTCRDLFLEAAQTIDNERGCQSFQNAYASQCGCFSNEEGDSSPPPPVSKLECPLCWNGDAPPWLDPVAIATATSNITCGEMQREMDTLLQTSDPGVSPRALCFLAQVTGSIHCGCPSPHPRASCWLCPDGSLPQHLAQTVAVGVSKDEKDNDGDDEKDDKVVERQTCAEIAKEMARIESQEECQEAVAQYAQPCGCPPVEMVTLP